MDDQSTEIVPQPKRFIWILIIIPALITLALGYVLGMRTTPTTNKKITPTIAPTISAAGIFSCVDADVDYAHISGTVTSNTNYYDQILIIINELKDGVTIKNQYDTRLITKPQADIVYPYSFNRVIPGLTYTISFSACHNNPNGTMVCVDNPTISSCYGKMQKNACVVDGSGTVDFSLVK